MRTLILGMGEIGKAVYEIFSKYHDITPFDVDYNLGYEQPEGKFEILLVCIPYQDKFVDIVNEYINEYNIKATSIFSTVPIGTTRKIENAVHTPVEGKHPKLAESMSKWQFTIGGLNELVYKFFCQANIFPVIMETPEYTEIAKLASTALYGVTLEFARYINEICKDNNIPYEYINFYNSAYNKLYYDLYMPQFSRSLLKPPIGNLGGHCITNNSKILENQYPSVFNQIIISDKEKK
jgi:UDP-glucose 6-dehydrogenase